MARPQEGLPSRVWLDIVRAAGKDENGAGCYEGQGEGDEGGEGGRAEGAHFVRDILEKPQSANLRFYRNGYSPLRRRRPPRKRRSAMSRWRQRCTRRGWTGSSARRSATSCSAHDLGVVTAQDDASASCGARCLSIHRTQARQRILQNGREGREIHVDGRITGNSRATRLSLLAFI